MIYADTDFFLALMKKSDWLKEPAESLLRQYTGRIRISPAVLIELLLLARRGGADPERLLQDVLRIAPLAAGDAAVFLKAARLMREHQANAMDSLHAASCGPDDRIISSDRVFDRMGVKRIWRGQEGDCSDPDTAGKRAP